MVTAAFDPVRWMTLASGVWLSLVVLAPVAPATVATFTYALGSLVCHQLADRSLHLAGAQLAVCARCTGIYAGGLVAFVFQLASARPSRTPVGPDVSRSRVWLVAGVLPTLITVVLEVSGWWRPSNVVRLTAGVPLGVAVAMVAGRTATLHYDQWRQRRLE